jgi:hypothetical protein
LIFQSEFKSKRLLTVDDMDISAWKRRSQKEPDELEKMRKIDPLEGFWLFANTRWSSAIFTDLNSNIG